MLTKDLRTAPRASASLGATRAAFGAFPDHEVAPGLCAAELTPPWPGGAALRPIPAGARPYAGAPHARVRVAAPRAPRRYGTPRPTVPPVFYRGPGRSGVPRARGACLQGNRWLCLSARHTHPSVSSRAEERGGRRKLECSKRPAPPLGEPIVSPIGRGGPTTDGAAGLATGDEQVSWLERRRRATPTVRNLRSVPVEPRAFEVVR